MTRRLPYPDLYPGPAAEFLARYSTAFTWADLIPPREVDAQVLADIRARVAALTAAAWPTRHTQG